jgi:hypothetical protein
MARRYASTGPPQQRIRSRSGARRRGHRARLRFGPRRRREPLSIALAAIMTAVIVSAVLTGGGEAAPPRVIPRAALTIRVGLHPTGRPIAQGFIGLSIEYPSLLSYAGLNPRAPNPVFLRLVRELLPGQRPRIRFGGDTADWTWWPTARVREPGAIKYALDSRWLRVARSTATALDARVTFGINFEANRRAVAGREASEFLRRVGPRYIDAFEVGNEPELYGVLGWYENRAGASILGRPHGYDFAHYRADFATISSALPHAVALSGPATGSTTWIPDLRQYLADNPRVRTATYHRYPLRGCQTSANSPKFATIAHLLASSASKGLAASIAPDVAAAHAHHASFRVDELNSATCGGAHGVSNVFASALWALNTLFSMVRVGVDGVNIHTFHHATYAPFDFTRTHRRWTAQVKPLYYGLLMFSQAAPPGSRLLPARGPARPGLHTWITRATDGTERVLLVNDSARASATVAVGPLAPPAGNARVLWLRAPRLSATSGITLGGRSFGASTESGALPGPLETAIVRPTRGRYVIELPPASAALVRPRARPVW